MVTKKIGTHTRFYINGGRDYEKWKTQNHGIVIDYREGCLQDYELVDCKGGVAVVFEHAVNTNKSNLKITFYRNPLIAYLSWDKFTDQYWRMEHNWPHEIWKYM